MNIPLPQVSEKWDPSSIALSAFRRDVEEVFCTHGVSIADAVT